MEEKLGCVCREQALRRAGEELSAVAGELRAAGYQEWAARIEAAAERIKE